MTGRGYTFGDTDLARERLGIVAHAFAEPTRMLLRDLPAGDRRYVLDLGCGPGYTSLLLREAFPHCFLTGVDGSSAMVEDARARVPSGEFFVGDVTAPVRLPAHVVFGRLVLGHLPDARDALATWARALLRNGVLVCEEPVRYRSSVEVFAEYERVVTAVVAERGGSLWASDALDVDPPGCERAIDRVVEHEVEAAKAAAMFWRNAATWGGSPALIDALREIERIEAHEAVVWELRQTVWVKV